MGDVAALNRNPEGALSVRKTPDGRPVIIEELEPVRVVAFQGGRMDRANAAKYLGLSPKTLANLAHSNKGPRTFGGRGRRYYTIEECDRWLLEGND